MKNNKWTERKPDGTYKQKYTSEAERQAAVKESNRRSQERVNKAYQTDDEKKVKLSLNYSTRRDEVLEKLGKKCAQCGYDKDIRALQIDHINGNGRNERRQQGWREFFSKILADSTGYQILCANCNFIKRYDNNEVAIVNPNLKSDLRNIKPALV